MAIRIQLRHDTSANWELNNPTLREGEFGIETDTLKIKVGPVPVTGDATAWSSITNYVNLVPSDFNNIINGYVEANDIGASGGVVGLNNDKNAIIPGSSIIIEGPTNDSYETTLTVTDPTADRTITLPDATGTLALTSQLPTQYTDELAQDAAAAALAAGTHTNITVTYNDAGNSISLTGAVTYTDENAQDAVGNAVGTGLSYNDTTGAISVDTSTIQARVTDVSDTEIGYLNGVTSAIQTQLDDKSTASKTETLTNKTLTTPTINGPTITATGQTPTIHGIYLPAPHNIIFEGTTADDFETTLQAGEPTADRTITLPDATGTVALVANVAALSGATFTGAVSGTDLTLSGNLTVNGTTTTLNSTTISVDDKNIELGSVETPSDATADGGGITLKGTTDKTFNWVDSTDAWTSSEHLNLASGKSLYLNGTLLKDATETITNKTINANANTITVTSANVSDFNEAAQDAIGTILGTGLSYNDSGPGIGVNYVTLGDTLLDGVSGASYGLIGTSVYLDVKNTNGYNKEIELDIAAVKTQLNADGYLTTSSTSTLTNKTLSNPTITTSSTTSLADLDTNFSLSANDGPNFFFAPDSTPSWAGLITGTYASPQAVTVSGVTGANATAANGTQQMYFDAGFYWFKNVNFAGSNYTSLTTRLPGIVITVTNASTVSSTELGHLDGVTSAIQTQLDAKVDESLFDTKGDLLVASADNTPAKLAVGTNGYLLTANSSATNGVEWAAAPVSLPSQSGESGKYLTTDGTTASWGTLVVPITTGTATITGNTATTIDTNALSGFTSIEYMISLKQGSKIRTSKVIVQTDGTSVDMTEFAITETGGTIAGVVISAAVSSTNAVLQVTATDAATTNVTVKFSEIKL
jgi:hypothetical protein